MTVLYVILAILIFGVLVAIHELGHFTAAKACGVRVEEFAVGMGPAIFKKKKGETEYSLRIVPFGGYCAMTGEDGDSDDPRAFVNQTVWKRLIILVAGAFMNFLLGFVIVLILFSTAEGFRSPVITEFMEGCPYESNDALHAGDRVWSIDGRRVLQYGDVGDFLARGDGVYDIVVIRDGKKVKIENLALTKLEYPGQEQPMYGFLFGGFDDATPGNVIRYSWYSTRQFVRLVWMSLGELVSGRVGVQDLAGPVGIVNMMAETGEQAASTADALYDIFYFGAFIAVNLAVMNLLPIPALDGGRVFFLLVTWIVESLTKKKIDPKYESYIHAAGMVLLLALMAYVMLHDIIRIVKQ